MPKLAQLYPEYIIIFIIKIIGYFWGVTIALIETSEIAKYTKSVSLALGLARTRGSKRYCLIVVRAISHSSFHPAWLTPLRVTKNGFRRSVNQEMNRPKVANQPVSCCTHILEAGAEDSNWLLSPSESP